MKRLLLLLPLICLVIPGCLLLSLQPYYEENDIVAHEAFAGKWESDDGKTTWEFTPKKMRYQVVVNEDGKTGAFKDGGRFRESGSQAGDYAQIRNS